MNTVSTEGTKDRRKIDMTTGPILGNVFLFAIPIVLGNILQQLYTTVDTWIVGKFGDATALAAMGTSSQPVEVLLCIFLGIGSGVSILVAQFIGAGSRDQLEEISATSISFIYACGIPLAMIGYFIAPALMLLMKVPSDTFDTAVSYVRIIFIGSLGNLGYNMNAGILRGLGDSRASLWFLVISCAANVILDILFVPLLGWGVQGAALSTIISQYLSWIISVIYTRKKFPELHFTYLPQRVNKQVLGKILAIGVPIGLNHSLFAVGHMVMQVLVNENGKIFMAGASVAGRVTGCANVAITGLSSAASTYSGQNFGAKNFDRLRKGHVLIPFVNGAITLTLGLIFILIRKPILGWFSDDETVLMYASRYVMVILLSQWMFAVYSTITSMVNGVGMIRFTTVVNLLMLWAIRIPCAYLIFYFYDRTWIMLCFPASFAFGMISMVLYNAFAPPWRRILRGEIPQNITAK